jgi:peptidoglycan/LPS O-acetylase OafA/YrhL
MAALLVAACHAALQMSAAGIKSFWFIELAGQVGVMVFFVLSGFLMGRLYLDQPLTFASLTRFARHRVARVFPLYLAVVGASYALYLTKGRAWPLYPIYDNNILNHLLFMSGVDVLWTIPVELQFYALFPVLWFTYSRLGSTTTLLWVGIIVAASVLLYSPGKPAIILHLPFFVLGVIAGATKTTLHGANTIFFVSTIGLVLGFPDIGRALELGMANNPWQSPACMALAAIVVLSAARAEVARKLLGGGIGHFTGRISYSIYLLHMPVLWIMLWIEAPSINSLSFMPVFLTAVIVVSAVSYHIFEAPARRLIVGTSPQSGHSGAITVSGSPPMAASSANASGSAT